MIKRSVLKSVNVLGMESSRTLAKTLFFLREAWEQQRSELINSKS